jgi:hypothetical protein
MGEDAERKVAVCRESRVVSKDIGHRTTLVEVAASCWRAFLLSTDRGPQAWKGRLGFSFLQGPGETQLIQVGAHVDLSPNPSRGDARPTLTPMEGDMPRI